ncbi:MAG: hypothetical protein AB7G44_03860 [Bacteroidia bacterium]|jgi:hypothetical protein
MNKNKIIAIVLAALTYMVFMPVAYFDIDLAHPVKGVFFFLFSILGFLGTMFFWGKK